MTGDRLFLAVFHVYNWPAPFWIDFANFLTGYLLSKTLTFLGYIYFSRMLFLATCDNTVISQSEQIDRRYFHVMWGCSHKNKKSVIIKLFKVKYALVCMQSCYMPNWKNNCYNTGLSYRLIVCTVWFVWSGLLLAAFTDAIINLKSPWT